MANDKKSAPKPAAPPTARAGDRRKERESRSRRNSILTIVAVVAIIVGLLAFGVWQANRPVEAPVPDGAQARYENVDQGTNRDGLPLLGDASVPVQVVLLTSYDCVPCKAFYESVRDPLLERVQDGSISLTVAPLYGYGDITNGQGAARAAICAFEQGEFWAYEEALYEWQQFGSQAFINARILSGAEALGMDRGTFNTCNLGGAPDGPVNAARTLSRSTTGFTNPPAVLINNALVVDENNQVTTDPAVVIAAVDRAIANLAGARRTSPEATPEATPDADATAEATAETTEAATIRATRTPRPTAEAIVEATPESTP